MPLQTNLELVRRCIGANYCGTEPISFRFYDHYILTWNEASVGYVPKIVIDALIALPEIIRNLVQGISSYEARCSAAATLCEYWRKNHTFRVLDGWRSELYPVYGPENELLWSVERSASSLFGIVTYGVHMTAYVLDSTAPYGLKIWVPRRALCKQTYGGMLDNTVAGGIALGEQPLQSLIRESREEAGLDKDLVRNHVKACGTVTYTLIRDSRAGGETGLIQPECQFVYDLELPENIIPSPTDGEVEKYYLWDVEKVQVALKKEEFKPNCALVLLDFFIRWKILTEENEQDYFEINRQIHRELELPTTQVLQYSSGA